MIPTICPLCQSPIIQKREYQFCCQSSETEPLTYSYAEHPPYLMKTNHYYYGAARTHHIETAFFNNSFRIVNYHKVTDLIIPNSTIEQWDGFIWNQITSFNEPIKINSNSINRFLNLKAFL